MANSDAITEKQIRMVWALKNKLGLIPDVTNIQQIDRQQARRLIDGLLEEVDAITKNENK